MTKILLPTNGSENAHKAGEYAISESALGADIIILYVIDTDYLDALSQEDLKEKLRMKLRKEGEEVINNYKTRIEDSQCQGYCKNVNLITAIKEGNIAEVIIKTIEEENIDQVIIGKSNKSSLETYLLENITKKVAKTAKIPVKVIS